jgi:uncharacterized protein YjbJ (UPF0337 family)
MWSNFLRRQVRVLGDAKSSLGDAESSLGDAKSSVGDAKSSVGDAQSSLGDVKSSLGDAKSSLADAKSSLGDAKSSLGDVKSSLGDAKSSLGDVKSSLGDAKSSLGDVKSSVGDAKNSLGDVKSSVGDGTRWGGAHERAQQVRHLLLRRARVRQPQPLDRADPHRGVLLVDRVVEQRVGRVAPAWHPVHPSSLFSISFPVGPSYGMYAFNQQVTQAGLSGSHSLRTPQLTIPTASSAPATTCGSVE